MKHYRSHSNFGLFDPLISFCHKKNPMGGATTKPHPLTHPHVVNNAHPVACGPHAKFLPDRSLISFWKPNISCGSQTFLVEVKQLFVGVIMT